MKAEKKKKCREVRVTLGPGTYPLGYRSVVEHGFRLYVAGKLLKCSRLGLSYDTKYRRRMAGLIFFCPCVVEKRRGEVSPSRLENLVKIHEETRKKRLLRQLGRGVPLQDQKNEKIHN